MHGDSDEKKDKREEALWARPAAAAPRRPPPAFAAEPAPRTYQRAEQLAAMGGVVTPVKLPNGGSTAEDFNSMSRKPAGSVLEVAAAQADAIATEATSGIQQDMTVMGPIRFKTAWMMA